MARHQPKSADLKARISWDEKDALYWFSGFAIDKSDWLVDFEYVEYEVEDSSDALNKSWFLALGRRFDKFVVTAHTEDYAQETNLDVLNGIVAPNFSGYWQRTEYSVWST